MSKFAHTKKNNPCPLCQDVSGDCRIIDEKILCHTYIDGDSPVSGYKWAKASKNGLWGVHFPDNGKAFDKEAWERNQQLKLEKASNEKRFLAENALGVEGRNQEFKRVASYRGLRDTHKQDLLNRGLTEDQVKSIPFFSVHDSVGLPHDTADNLPGLKTDYYTGEKQLSVDYSGYFIPSFDVSGRINGGQCRLEGVTKGGKYRWLKGIHSSKLPNGELPITFIKGTKQSDTLYLTEGILKPLVASFRHDIDVCGAAGGYFSGSPEQFKAIASNYQKIVICPDGGDVINPKVMQRWEHQYKFLRSLGKDVKFAWWGQITKDHDDIDELPSSDNYELKTWDEFQEISSRAIYEQKVKDTQNKLRTLSINPDILLKKEDLKDGRYLPDDLIDKLPTKGLILLLGSKGIGKSVLLKKIKDRHIDHGKKVVSITPRIALGREQAEKWGITWIEDSGIAGLSQTTVLNHIESIGLCWDSFHKTANRDYAENLMLIDEAELGFSHLLTSQTLKDNRPYALKAFEDKAKECLENDGLMVLSDADLTDLSVDYVKNLVPDVPIFTVAVEAKTDPCEVIFYSDKETVMDLIIEDLNAGKNIMVFVDSQAECEALEQILKERYPKKIFGRVDRKITATPEGQNFVKRPNESILKEKPNGLIYNSSMGVGVSIEGEASDHFDVVYGLSYAVLEPSQFSQGLFRNRKLLRRVVWCETSGNLSGCTSFLPEVVNKSFHKYHDQGLKLLDLVDDSDPLEYVTMLNRMINPETGLWNNPHIKLFSELKARSNYGRKNFREQLIEQLQKEGHNVTVMDAEDSTEDVSGLCDNVKSQKKINKQEEAAAIATAKDISLDDAKLIAKKINPSEEESYQASKAFLKADLPGLELTPEFVYKSVVKDQRRWLNAVKLYWFSQHPEAAKEHDRQQYRARLSQFASSGVTFLPDIKTYLPSVKLTNDLKVFELIDILNPDRVYKESDPDVQEFAKRAYFMRYRVHNVYNLTVTQKTKPMRLIGSILEKFGLAMDRHKVRVGEKTQWEFRLRQSLLYDEDRQLTLQSLTKKWLETQAQKEVQSVPELLRDTIYNQRSLGTNLTHGSNHQVSAKDDPNLSAENITEVSRLLSGSEDREHLQIMLNLGFSQQLINLAIARLPQNEQVRVRGLMSA